MCPTLWVGFHINLCSGETALLQTSCSTPAAELDRCLGKKRMVESPDRQDGQENQWCIVQCIFCMAPLLCTALIISSQGPRWWDSPGLWTACILDFGFSPWTVNSNGLLSRDDLPHAPWTTWHWAPQGTEGLTQVSKGTPSLSLLSHPWNTDGNLLKGQQTMALGPQPAITGNWPRLMKPQSHWSTKTSGPYVIYKSSTHTVRVILEADRQNQSKNQATFTFHCSKSFDLWYKVQWLCFCCCF